MNLQLAKTPTATSPDMFIINHNETYSSQFSNQHTQENKSEAQETLGIMIQHFYLYTTRQAQIPKSTLSLDYGHKALKKNIGWHFVHKHLH